MSPSSPVVSAQSLWFRRAIRTPAALVLIGLFATGFGYRAGLDHARPPAVLRLSDLPDASEFTRCDTFSEIGMLQSRLRGLCHRTLHQLNIATLQQRRRASDSVEAPAPVIDALADLVAEVRQTPQEEPVLKILLFRLSRATAYNRWLDLYLDFTRRNPLSALVMDLQNDAKILAEKCGRDAELATLSHLLDQWKGLPSNNPLRR